MSDIVLVGMIVVIVGGIDILRGELAR